MLGSHIVRSIGYPAGMHSWVCTLLLIIRNVLIRRARAYKLPLFSGL